MKFLIIDDSATMRRIIVRSLTEIGFSDFVEAENGISALKKLEPGDIEFIITDWNMPTMGGLEFVQTVRDLGITIPILMVTTNADSNSVVSALKAGVNNYVVKPFSPATLQAKVQSMTAQ